MLTNEIIFCIFRRDPNLMMPKSVSTWKRYRPARAKALTLKTLKQSPQSERQPGRALTVSPGEGGMLYKLLYPNWYHSLTGSPHLFLDCWLIIDHFSI